jgi:UPF0755 protein
MGEQQIEPRFAPAPRGYAELPRSPAEALEPARASHMPNSGRRPRREMNPLFAFLSGGLTLIMVGFIAVGGVVYFAKYQFDRAGPLDHSTVLVIPKGEGITAIAERLEREGVIRDRRIFVGAIRYFQFKNPDKMKSGLKAGEYEIRKQASMRNILDTLTQGLAILHKATIPEGFTSGQVVQRLLAHPLLTGDITSIPAEGSLLPDTYRFSRGTTRAEIIERMQAEQRKFVAKIWKTRVAGLPIKTPEEAIILASIVEKETGRADERARIAGVFINRLNRGIRLQSDPTIIYGIVGTRGYLGRPILKSEIQKQTPYNTYQIDGLPPTPISNPGRAAIEAVLNPEPTKALYFVADGTGGHAFGETLDEHRANVANWRKIEKEIRKKQEQDRNEALASQLTDAAQNNNTDLAEGSAGNSVPDHNATVMPGISVMSPDNGLQNSVVRSGRSLSTENKIASNNGDATDSENNGSIDIPLPVRRPRTQ